MSTSSTPSASSSTSQDLGDQFMAMFIASLQNQDPTEPLDADQMTTQLAQIASLEEQEKTNENLKYLAMVVENVGNMVAMDLTGKDATVAVGKFEWDATQGGNIDGTIIVDDTKLEYDYKIDVKDEHGNVVATVDATLENGELVYNWDGTDNDGNPVPSGEYEFEAYYEDTTGGKIVDDTAIITTTATITRMTFFPTSSMGLSNGMSIDDAAILAVLTKDGEEITDPALLGQA